MIELIKITLLLVTAVALFYTLISSSKKGASKRYSNFLLSSVVITLFLILINEIKFHHILRDLFNIPNTLTYIIYALILFSYLFYNYRKILSFNVLLFIAAIICFATATGLDLLTDGKIIEFENSDFLEKTIQLTGTFLWSFYFIHISFTVQKT